MLTKDELLAATLAEKTVPIAGLGEVKLREMTGAQRDEYEADSYAATQSGDYSGVRLKLVALSLAEPCLSCEEVGQLPWRVVDPLHDEALEINGLVEGDAGN